MAMKKTTKAKLIICALLIIVAGLMKNTYFFFAFIGFIAGCWTSDVVTNKYDDNQINKYTRRR